MKAFGVYGEKRIFLFYLLTAGLALAGGLVFYYFAATTGESWLYYVVFFFGAVCLYTLYLAFYEGLFRYEALRHGQGTLVKAVITHVDPRDGSFSKARLGVVTERNGQLAVGKLVGTFGPFFSKKHPEGTKVYCYRLKTGELLVLASQRKPSKSLAA